MDWNQTAVLASGCVVVIVLGICVALGHDSSVTDGLLAASALVTGGTLIKVVAKKN